ncbi:MAG: Rid family detoxifying hydrolase [Psychroflexus sp.]|nr:Rid family detoxifying hydrolase [Psychroflexus sp.]MDN6309547.1 Rid family detoxifying hydrolase [Psychroflexus sp.]
MSKKIINTAEAPQPIGAYNQSILKNGFLYTSGQIAINPETGETEFGELTHETKLVMNHLSEILKAAEMTFENVIKVSIFVKDITKFSEINAIYSSFFEEETAPAREMVQVADLPKHANIEISLIAAE